MIWMVQRVELHLLPAIAGATPRICECLMTTTLVWFSVKLLPLAGSECPLSRSLDYSPHVNVSIKFQTVLDMIKNVLATAPNSCSPDTQRGTRTQWSETLSYITWVRSDSKINFDYLSNGVQHILILELPEIGKHYASGILERTKQYVSALGLFRRRFSLRV